MKFFTEVGKLIEHGFDEGKTVEEMYDIFNRELLKKERIRKGEDKDKPEKSVKRKTKKNKLVCRPVMLISDSSNDEL